LAYDVWLKYGHQTQLLSPAQWLAAEAAFLSLIASHPEFDRGYASLAALYNTKHFIFPGVFRDTDRAKRALDLAGTAIRIDPRGVHGHRAAAYAYALLGDYNLAEHHFRLVLDLNDNALWSQFSAGAGLGICGKWDEATRIMANAMTTTRFPTPDMSAYYAYNCLARGDYQTTIELASRANQITLMSAVSIAALALTQNTDAARAQYQKLYAKLRQGWEPNTASTDREITRWILQMSPAATHEARDRLQAGLDAVAPISNTER
jgi:tetratricopeptide (TPR) repeat protein